MFSIIWLFFTLLVSTLGWHDCQLDVWNAYLYADLSHGIFMSQPPGYVDPHKRDHLCFLKKALYGLHQSGREWFFKLDEVLKELGFKGLEWSNCVYVLRSRILLLVYVDDIVIFAPSVDDINVAVQLLQSKFDIKILGETKKLLGIEFVREHGECLLHQQSYISSVYRMFQKYDVKIRSLPISKGSILSKLDCPQTPADMNEMSNIPYRSLLGCLAFIASRTRPDICFAVNVLSQFQENPGKCHWQVLLSLLGYVQSTRHYMLRLAKADQIILDCFSDSDFASNRDDRISMGGMFLAIGKSTIAWRTFKQKCVALSTMEAEYVALTDAAKELLWMRNVLSECVSLGIVVKAANLYCDNMSAIDFSASRIENIRSKHIDIKYHFLRELVVNKTLNVKYVTSRKNLADIFTKALTREGLDSFCREVFSG